MLVPIWAVTRAWTIVDWFSRVRAERLATLQPNGRPIELIAADIRRLAAEVDALSPRAPRSEREAAVLADDDSLTAAGRALGVDVALDSLPFGPRRALRARVERQLECAGLVLPGRRAA